MTDQESLLAAINEEVHLQPHDPSWAQAFQLERQRLDALLPGIFIDIAHVGSTAVPGLIAKPVIDLMAGVESMDVARSLSDRLCASSYTTSAEFNAGLVDRQWFMRWADGHRTHHLHVVVHASPVWHEHVRFRDALRSSATLAARYAALKLELATRHVTDREAYTQAKAEFIRSVLLDG